MRRLRVALAEGGEARAGLGRATQTGQRFDRKDLALRHERAIREAARVLIGQRQSTGGVGGELLPRP